MRVGGTVLGHIRPPIRQDDGLINRMSARPAQQPFAGALQEALDKTNELQQVADAEAEAVATGRSGDIHKAIVAMRQAELSLELTSQVLQRALEAYKEVSRMQV